MLWDYYQWWRNDPVSLLTTTTTLYSAGWYQTWWLNINGTNFIINSVTPFSWMALTQHNLSSWVVWTDLYNPWPCPSNYHIPTTSISAWIWEWRRIVEIVTSKNWIWWQAWGNIDNIILQKFLLLPMAWFREYSNWAFNWLGSYWIYSSSSPMSDRRQRLFFYTSVIDMVNPFHRSLWFSVRCIKN